MAGFFTPGSHGLWGCMLGDVGVGAFQLGFVDWSAPTRFGYRPAAAARTKCAARAPPGGKTTSVPVLPTPCLFGVSGSFGAPPTIQCARWGHCRLSSLFCGRLLCCATHMICARSCRGLQTPAHMRRALVFVIRAHLSCLPVLCKKP